MKKLLTTIVALIGFGLIHSANATTNNETYIPPVNNNNTEVTNGGEKQNNQYSFTLFDFFFKSETKAKTDSSQIKVKAIDEKTQLKAN